MSAETEGAGVASARMRWLRRIAIRVETTEGQPATLSRPGIRAAMTHADAEPARAIR
jgi:hypothetical protein